MGRHEITLDEKNEMRLEQLSRERNITKEDILTDFVTLLLSPPHSMEGEQARLAYEEWAKTYLSWSENGTD